MKVNDMIKSKLILTDVDEVLLHWTGAFTRFIKEHHDIIPSRVRDDHYIAKWLEIHPDEAFAMVKEFNSSDDFGMLEPFDSAQSVLGKLSDEGFRFVAITSCSSDGIVERLRRQNLVYYFGNIFEEVHCLDFDDDKGRVLSRYPKAIWVEDSMDWAVRGADLGHATFLIDHEHNKSLVHPHIMRVKDWNTIYRHIHLFSDNPEIPASLPVTTEN